MVRTILVVLAGLMAFPASVLAQASPIQMSVLPNARAGVVDTDITFFASVVNSSETEANSCRHTGFDRPNGLPAGVTGTVEVFALDESRNIEGNANSFFTIPAGGRRDLLIAFDIDAPMSGTLTLSMRCQFETNEFRFAPVYQGVNDFQLTVTATAGPDIVMIGDTLSGDGVMRVAQTPRTGLFVVSAVNIGAEASNLIVTPSYLGFSALNNLRTEICETNASGVCTSARGETVTVASWTNGQVRTFAAFFVQSPHLGLPFFPDVLRAQVQIGAAPPASGDLSAPAGEPIEAPLAQTSAATLAEVGSGAAMPDEFWGSYQCSLQEQLPLGSSVNWTGGEYLAWGEYSDDSPWGYVRASDQLGSTYWQPYVVTGVDEAIHNAAQEVVVSLLGMGEGRLQVTDRDVTGSAILRPFQSVVISLPATSGLVNSFEFPTRMRCVPSPSNDPATQPQGDAAAEGLAGDYSARDVNAAEPGNPTTARFQTFEPGVSRMYVENNPLGTVFSQISDSDPARGDPDVITGFHAFFQALSEIPGINRAPRVTSRRPQSRTAAADCAVVVETDTSTDPEMQDRDARVLVIERDGVDLNEGECVL